MRNQSKKIKLFGILYFFLIFNSILYGQNKIDGFAINPKIGRFNWTEDINGYIAGIEVNAIKKDMIFSVDFYNAEDFNIFGKLPAATYNQFDLLFGKYIDWNIFRLQYQGGLGALWGVYPGDLIQEGGLFSSDIHEEVSYFTVGVPLKLGFKIMPTRFTSIGLDFQANLNLKNSLYMVMLSIEIGKLRDKIN
jgi:hypothetical protein